MIHWVINQLNGSFSLRCNEQLILINEPIIIFLYKNISWNRESCFLSAPDCLYKTNKVYKLGMRKRDKNQCNRHWVAEEYINTSFDLKKNTTMKKMYLYISNFKAEISYTEPCWQQWAHNNHYNSNALPYSMFWKIIALTAMS